MDISKKKKTHGYLEMNSQDSIKRSIKCHCFCRMIRGRKRVKEYSFTSLTSSFTYKLQFWKLDSLSNPVIVSN
jgi:hypothetical protein